MFCATCGTKFDDSTSACPACGSTAGKPAAAPAPVAPPADVAVARAAYYKERNANVRSAIKWLVLPALCVPPVMILLFLATIFSSRNNILSSDDTLTAVGAALTFVATVGGFVAAVFHLRKRPSDAGLPHDERSGRGAESVVPDEIRGWNWGASGLTWVWGLAFGVWISLLALVPVVGVVFWIVLGLRGSEWAWRAERWESVAAFKVQQVRWQAWGIALTVLWAYGTYAAVMRMFS